MCPHGDQPPTLLRMYPYSEQHSMSFWAYRRLLDAACFDDPAIRGDVALILCYSNDYRDAPIVDRPPDAVLSTLRGILNPITDYLSTKQARLQQSLRDAEAGAGTEAAERPPETVASGTPPA